MGLSVEVGVLADLTQNDPEGAEYLRTSFAACNKLLATRGLPAHEEPESLPPFAGRADCNSFNYSSIHHLRHAYAYRMRDPNWTVTESNRELRASDDVFVREITRERESHLLCHSDSQGFYLPVRFEKVLVDVSRAVPGNLLGSTPRLIEELIFVAPAIGVVLDNGTLSNEEATAINERVDDETGPHIEQMVWITLYEAARLSLEHRTAIVFS